MANNKIQLKNYANFRHYSSTDEQQKQLQKNGDNGRQIKRDINWQKRATCTFIAALMNKKTKRQERNNIDEINNVNKWESHLVCLG